MTFDDFFALVQTHVKTDGDDNDVLTQYCNSAVGTAAGFCRRNLYWTQDDLTAAQATFGPGITAAENAWQAARDQYAPKVDTDPIDAYYNWPHWKPETTQDRINQRMLAAAWKTYVAQISALNEINDGIVIDDTIIAALLLITGHFYRNRQEIISQAGAVAIQLPMGAQKILEPYMAV